MAVRSQPKQMPRILRLRSRPFAQVSRESLNSFWQGECAAVQSGWRVQSQAVLVP